MKTRNVVWKTPDFSADVLKMFACVVMILGNIGKIIIERGMLHVENYTQESFSEALAADAQMMQLAGISSMLQLLSGLAVPIVAFLLVEGFRHTKSRRSYVIRLLIAALVSEIPYDYAMTGKFVDFSTQNAITGTLICLIMLMCLETVEEKTGKSKILKVLVVFAAICWAALFRAEYGLCMVLLTAVFYIFYDRPLLKMLLGGVISLLYVTGPLALYGIWCYDEKRRDLIHKYVYYCIYPLHLFVLGMIAAFL